MMRKQLAHVGVNGEGGVRAQNQHMGTGADPGLRSESFDISPI